MKKESGFTIIELFIALTIFVWLVSAATPNFRSFILSNQADTEARQILRHLQKTRELAIYSGREMTFCGINNNLRCARDNIKRFVVFFDANGNQRLDSSESIETELSPKFDGRIYLRASGRHHIRYFNDGRSNAIGSIFLCPRNAEPTLIRRVTTNMAGRPYLARPLQNGIVAHWDKSPIDCAALPN